MCDGSSRDPADPADDRHHQACADLLETHPGPLIVPTLVITEAYLLGTRLGTRAELRFLADLASGSFDIEAVHPVNWLCIADLVDRYSSLSLGTLGASVIACAERLGVGEVASVDRRHFTVVKANQPLTLLP